LIFCGSRWLPPHTKRRRVKKPEISDPRSFLPPFPLGKPLPQKRRSRCRHLFPSETRTSPQNERALPWRTAQMAVLPSCAPRSRDCFKFFFTVAGAAIFLSCFGQALIFYESPSRRIPSSLLIAFPSSALIIAASRCTPQSRTGAGPSLSRFSVQRGERGRSPCRLMGDQPSLPPPVFVGYFRPALSSLEFFPKMLLLVPPQGGEHSWVLFKTFPWHVER